MKQILFYLLLLTAGGAQAQQVYTLKSCLEQGLDNNYSIRISKNEEQVSRNNATIGNAGYLPTIDLTGGYTGNLNNNRTEPFEGVTVTDNNIFDQGVNAGLKLNWTIFDGFKMTTNYARLKELEQMGELNTRLAIEDFVAGLTAEYYNFVQQKIRSKNFLYAVSLSKERLRIVEARYQIGNFSRLDLQQARVDFNADSAKYMNQQEQLHTSRIRLNQMIANEEVNERFHTTDSLINLNFILSWDDLWQSTLKTNTSLLKAEKNSTLSKLDLKTVYARNYPYLKLNSGYGYNLNKYELGTTAHRQTMGLNVGLTVGINLFDGNRRREKRNAQIGIENAALERRDLELALKSDLSNLWQAYLNNIEVLKLERQNIEAAKENLEIAMERYLLGNLSGIEMREAQKSLLDAEERILSAAYNTKLCEISLLQISGKIGGYLGTD